MSNSIAKSIERLMIDNNLTQKELAKLSGLTEAAISNYLSKKREPNKISLSKIAKALNTTVEELQIDVSTSTLTSLGIALSSVAILSPFGMISTMTGMAAGLVSVNKKNISNQNDVLLNYEKELKRFKNNSIGEIQEKLSLNKIKFSFNSNDCNNPTESKPDYSLTILDQKINSWWFIFWKESNNLNKHYRMDKKERAALLISKFVITQPDKYRKSSIVVDDEELYREILKFERNISYKGNLSVILFSEKELRILSENNISFYDDSINNLLTLI